MKSGRRVTGIKFAWWMKSYEEVRQAFTEVRRHSAGRKARISGTAANLSVDLFQLATREEDGAISEQDGPGL